MSVNQSLNYLARTECAEVRAGINSLFEITATNSKTLCCRVSTSHDLVVRDEKFRISRFCINGAELVDHPLRIYISPDCTVGTINQKKVYITEDAINAIPIQYDSHTGCDYYVGNDNINCRSDVITLQWTASTSVEMKAITLAFAIQCALTRHPITESVPVSLDNIYDSKKDVTSSADVQFQAQPIEHKPYKQSIFDTVDKDVSVFIRVAGWSLNGIGNFCLVFNSSSPHDVLLVVHHFKIREKWLTKIFDMDGNEQAVATGESNQNGFCSQVTHNKIQLGQIFWPKQKTDPSVLESTTSTIYEAQSKTGRHVIFKYSSKFKTVATIGQHMGLLVKLEITKETTADEKKLLLYCAISRSQVVYTIHKRIPTILPISFVSCNCAFCEECTHTGRSSIFRSLSKQVFIRAAGYSRIKNLVYFDVFSDPINFVIHTVECTPRENQKGVVKLVIKGQWSNTLWTAVQFPEDIFAFYSKDDKLLGYQWKNMIFNAQNQEVMHIETQSYTHKAQFQQDSPPEVKMAIIDNNNLLVAIINEDINCTSIFRPRARIGMAYGDLLVLTFAIPLAVKMNSVIYKMDKAPLPEISYHYRNVREMGINVF